MKTHLPRLNELRKVLASAEKNLHSGTRSNASHYTESAPPDGRKPNFQAASGEGISTHENDATDRDAMSEIDSVVTNELPDHPDNVADTSTKVLTTLICEYVPSYDVLDPADIHPRTVLIYIFKSRNQSSKAGGTSKGSKSRKSPPAQESEQHLRECPDLSHQIPSLSSAQGDGLGMNVAARRRRKGSFLMPGREGTNGTRS